MPGNLLRNLDVRAELVTMAGLTISFMGVNSFREGRQLLSMSNFRKSAMDSAVAWGVTKLNDAFIRPFVAQSVM